MKFAIRDGWRIQIRSVLVVVLLYFTVRVWRVVNRVAECQSYEYHEFPMLLAERKRKQKRKEKLPWIMDDHGWPEADRSGRQAHRRACPDRVQAMCGPVAAVSTDGRQPTSTVCLRLHNRIDHSSPATVHHDPRWKHVPDSP